MDRVIDGQPIKVVYRVNESLVQVEILRVVHDSQEEWHA